MIGEHEFELEMDVLGVPVVLDVELQYEVFDEIPAHYEAGLVVAPEEPKYCEISRARIREKDGRLVDASWLLMTLENKGDLTKIESELLNYIQ